MIIITDQNSPSRCPSHDRRMSHWGKRFLTVYWTVRAWAISCIGHCEATPVPMLQGQNDRRLPCAAVSSAGRWPSRLSVSLPCLSWYVSAGWTTLSHGLAGWLAWMWSGRWWQDSCHGRNTSYRLHLVASCTYQHKLLFNHLDIKHSSNCVLIFIFTVHSCFNNDRTLVFPSICYLTFTTAGISVLSWTTHIILDKRLHGRCRYGLEVMCLSCVRDALRSVLLPLWLKLLASGFYMSSINEEDCYDRANFFGNCWLYPVESSWQFLLSRLQEPCHVRFQRSSSQPPAHFCATELGAVKWKECTCF